MISNEITMPQWLLVGFQRCFAIALVSIPLITLLAGSTSDVLVSAVCLSLLPLASAFEVSAYVVNQSVRLRLAAGRRIALFSALAFAVALAAWIGALAYKEDAALSVSAALTGWTLVGVIWVLVPRQRLQLSDVNFVLASAIAASVLAIVLTRSVWLGVALVISGIVQPTVIHSILRKVGVPASR